MDSSYPIATARQCWICGSRHLVRVRDATLPTRLSSEDFAICNADYGHAGAIDRCVDCGFHQCTEMEDVLPFYEAMEDPSYEETRKQRALQEKAVLDSIPLDRPNDGLRLLDVGAGSGILVEAALRSGYDAVGVEPSFKLQHTAAQLGLPVARGVLPHPEIVGPFDVITIIDVIEHVRDPLYLIEQATRLLSPGGVVVVVTPDRTSMAARMMGRRWWHYRVAHIGYFEPRTLRHALERSGLKEISFKRPTWYFPADYLCERLMRYVPAPLRFPIPRTAARLTLPLNLRDSMMISAIRS